MIMWCRELNKDFDSENDMFAELKNNKEDILGLKKAAITKSCDKGAGIVSKSLDYFRTTEETKGLKMDDDFYYIAVNATNVLDSHGDMHVKNLWKKTIKDNQGKNYLVLDHDLSIPKVVARKADIEMFTAEVPFSTIGKAYSGTTEILIYKFPKNKIINQTAKEWLESGEELESSVRMRYISIKLAMKSEKPEDAEELKTYNEYYDLIANKEDFEDIKYFWVVTEAENVKESSLVLFGSNSSTGQLKGIKEKDSLDDSDSAAKPPISTPEKRRKSII